MAEVKNAINLENQVLYSVDIGDKDSSISIEDFMRSTNSGTISEIGKSGRSVCYMQERKMVTLIAIFDMLTFIRIPATFCSFMSSRGFLFYYKFRVLSFGLFFIAALAIFIFQCYESF